MNSKSISFKTFLWRTSALHVITYFIVGIIVMNVFDYQSIFSSGNLKSFMRPLDSPWVALGPALQIFRGLIFAVVLWPFKAIFLDERNGWLKLWMLFLGLSIFSTFGPALGSVDGMIYTTIPINQQLLFLPELMIQSLLLSLGICHWHSKPRKAYHVISIVLFVLIVLMSIAGFMAANG